MKFRRPTKDPGAQAPAPPSPPPGAPATGAAILEQYVRSAPSPQHAVDLFAGSWSSAFPPEIGVTAGPLPVYADDRIDAVLAHLGDVTGMDVLELGPLEAGHTVMLHRSGAHVTAVEASATAYLKCLITKELCRLDSARFLLGDFLAYLRETDRRFDLVVASGVLYHAPDPLALLEAIARVTDRVAIWTHYFDERVVRADPTISRVFLDEPETVSWRGHEIRLHRRHYREALQWSGFCGGPEPTAVWLELPQLLDALRAVGFTTVDVLDDDTSNVNGAAVLLCASR